MIRASLPLLAAAAFAAAPASQAQVNLLVNPGFEADVLAPETDTPGATGWTDFNNTAFTRFQSPRSGDNAFKVFGGGGAFQDFTAVPGVEYAGQVFGLNPSFDALAGDAIGAVNLEFRDATGALIGDILTNAFLDATTAQGDSNGGEFPEVYIEGNVSGIAPVGTTTVRFALFSGNGGGAAYFDDASLTVVPEPASLAILGLGGLALLTRRR